MTHVKFPAYSYPAGQLLPESLPEPGATFPKYRQIGEVFGGKYEIVDHVEWLHSGITTPRQLEKQLSFAETVNIREFILPDNWESEKKRIFEKQISSFVRCK